ncbi:PREDICTED: ATP-dependent DNA helicase PIF1-like [Ipomoea nil]|uniref:ATP-dependent DNA helicase PIF1-like n=1 Tax=Ipomoea nil TaxID=35883 RepID=UPI000901E1BE|nr:PREDICTED: ATP-dependent DNA helicase PIF1-like [Ipomoea nil]
MAICRFIDYPNLFITFTCNPKWPEIQRFLEKRNLKAEDRPDIVCRVFKMKLEGKLFGAVRAVIYTIEFQKRGLPHAHILLFLQGTSYFANPAFMDTIISAEIPDKLMDIEYYKAVEEFMLHGPCGVARSNSPCMVNGKCSKHFPRRYIDASHFDQDDLVLTEEEKKNFALFELENLLGQQNKSLKGYPPMPIPSIDNSRLFQNRLVFEELCYNREQLKEDAEVLCAKLTEEQSLIYDTVIQDIEDGKGGLFFVYGYGGTGKTFLWRALLAAIRCKGQIVLNVASSGIASILLPGGRTAHSRFAIPIAINEDSTCNIKQGSDLTELLIKTSLIIWDEAPMMHKHCFEALDRTMRDLLRFVDPCSEMKTFGGKTVVLGRDFRQILPVVPKGTCCKVLRLTQNLRLSSVPNGGNRQALQEFADWIANVGDGKLGGRNDGFAEVEIPKHMLLSSGGDDIKTIVHSTFPMFANGNTDPEHLLGRAILAPTLDVVNAVNDYMTELHNAESRSYYSSDAVCKVDGDNGIFGDVHTPEFLNSIRVSGLPNHTLTLKIGSPVMLMRNIDHSLGLCNGVRLIITKLADHVIEGEILTRPNKGTKVLIPRMSISPSDPRLPFKFQRRQFPIMLSYAMTINKSQVQTLTHVGLILKKPVFVHGQLYVAASRVNNPDGLKILIVKDPSSTTTSTTNVVYHEVFNNL